MSLTDARNNGTLKKGWYYVKFDNEIYPDFYDGYFVQTGDKHGLEVLAPCDYDHFAELSKKVEAQNEEIQGLKNGIDNYQLLIDRLESSNEKLGITLEQLCDLLKECKPYISYKINQNKHVGFTPDDADLLTRINSAIGESEE